MEKWLKENLKSLSEKLAPCQNCPLANTTKEVNLPGTSAVIDLLGQLIALLFPGCHGYLPLAYDHDRSATRSALQKIALTLQDQIQRAFTYSCRQQHCKECRECDTQAQSAVKHLLKALITIREILQEDIQAAYEGDPAAMSTMEIVMSYPGLYAIATHRIAHTLYQQGVPLIPRIMSEQAHSRTGIDIHPGAEIGAGFFIDHGTGVVIGETCVIGRRVKIYQGVTLGALSFAKDDDGKLVKGIKRHPNVEDNVIIYAGATILGGDTVIGHDAIIGGNVWLTHSVPPFTRVYNQSPRPIIRTGRSQAGDYCI